MMKNWLNKNYKILIILAFLIPIIIVAVVSISHVTIWYGISNPLTWAMYLSLGVEIAALSALAAISANMGRNVYFPFIIVTLIQFIGNIFFSYQFISIDSKIFKDWVDLVTPLLSAFGVEEGNMVAHRRFLAVFSGGLLPLISLSFLHMLVKFSEDARLHKHNVINDDDKNENIKNIVDEHIIAEEIKKRTENNEVPNIVTSSDIVGEVSKIRLSEDDLKKLEEVLMKPKEPNEALKVAAEDYKNSAQNNVTTEEMYDFDNEEGYDEEIEQIFGNEEYNITDEEIIEVIENNTQPVQTPLIEDTPISEDSEVVVPTPTPTLPEQTTNNEINFEISAPFNEDSFEKKN